MQLGSATMLTLCPVYIRMRSLRAVLPDNAGARGFDLKRFARVPQWLVEYKALQLCVAVVLFYQLLLHVLCAGALYLLLVFDDEAAAIVTAGSGYPGEEVGLGWFSVFTAVSAYCNCGFALLPTSLILFATKPAILLVVEILILGGNVLLPVFLYLAITTFESNVDPSGSMVVAARYLLLNGRHIYSNLFGLQEESAPPKALLPSLLIVVVRAAPLNLPVRAQTWVLLIVQAVLTVAQTMLTMFFAHQPFGSSLFQSINTRSNTALALAELPSCQHHSAR